MKAKLNHYHHKRFTVFFLQNKHGKPCKLEKVKSNEREKVKCPKCNVEVQDGNFCEHCGAKLKQVCDCWVLKKKYNCGFDECKGYKLLIDSIKGKEFS